MGDEEPSGAPFLVEDIPDALDGERIDRVVALLTNCSRAEAVDLITSGAVRVGTRTPSKPSLRLAAGDVVTVSPRSPAARACSISASWIGLRPARSRSTRASSMSRATTSWCRARRTAMDRPT